MTPNRTHIGWVPCPCGEAATIFADYDGYAYGVDYGRDEGKMVVTLSHRGCLSTVVFQQDILSVLNTERVAETLLNNIFRDLGERGEGCSRLWQEAYLVL